jgi:2,3-bisphosphoglycerate-independent phosphoglycerate mutase
MNMRIFYVIADGLGDLPIHQLGNRTPLEYALKPNIDQLAKEGFFAYPKVIDDLAPESDVGVLANLSYDPRKYAPGRGYFEAIGSGLDVKEGDLAVRINFGEVEGSKINSVRTLMNQEQLDEICEYLEKNIKIPGVELEIKPGKVYRAAAVFRSKEKQFSPFVSNSEPGYEFKFFGRAKVGYAKKEPMKIRKVKAYKKEAKFTADVLNEFISQAARLLAKYGKPNYLFIRGASTGSLNPPLFSNKFNLRAYAIVGMPLEIGIAKYLGFSTAKIEEIEEIDRIEEDLKIKSNEIKRSYSKYDFIYIHIKQTDAVSHLGLFAKKARVIELMDKYIFGTIKEVMKEDDIVVLSCDHRTSSIKRIHLANNIPVMIHFPGKKNDLPFGERYAQKMHIKLKEIKDLIPLLIK